MSNAKPFDTTYLCDGRVARRFEMVVEIDRDTPFREIAARLRATADQVDGINSHLPDPDASPGRLTP